MPKSHLNLPLMLTIDTPRLILRDFTLLDAEAVFAYRRLPEATQYVPDEAYITVYDAEELIQKFVGWQFASPRRHFVLAITLDGSVIGEIGLVSRDDDEPAAEAELGFMLHPSFWNRGYASEAVKAVVDYGLNAAGWRRIMAICDIDNAASIKILTKVGMAQEAYLPRQYEKQEQWRHALRFVTPAQEANTPERSSGES